ncbi:MAG: hypothetical protein Q9168_006630 [Polycauliona sp. 1 TL-2023]
MNRPCLSIRPYEQRPAYQPTDPVAFIKLQQLRCVRDGDAGLGPEVRLCSSCEEVSLGEPLLDGKGDATEDRIAFYELPCGHLRCCSCALKYLDPAGIFHEICHFCDSQKHNLNIDFTSILGTIGQREEPDMSWIKGFYDGKRKKPAIPKPSPRIELLPPIQEDREVDLATFDEQTPIKNRVAEQRRIRVSPRNDITGHARTPQLQWTPRSKSQREADRFDSESLSEVEDYGYTVMMDTQKKHKLWSWANSPEGTLPDQSFEDWLEEEEKQQPRKKLRLSF